MMNIRSSQVSGGSGSNKQAEKRKPKKKGANPADELSEEQKLEFLQLFARFVSSEKLPPGKDFSPEQLEILKHKVIAEKDLERICKTHGYGHNASNPINAQEIKEMMKEVDDGGEGSIDFNEFLNLMAKNLNENELVEEVVKAFKVLNVKVDMNDTQKENENLISAANLKYFMTNFGEKLTEEEVDELFNEADIQLDKNLNIEEFVRSTILK